MKVRDYLKNICIILELNHFMPLEYIEYLDGTELTPGQQVRLFGLLRVGFFNELFVDSGLFITEMKSKALGEEFWY